MRNAIPYYDLNFFAFGTFSPDTIFSAPTFLPLLGQPYLGPNKLQAGSTQTRAPTTNKVFMLRAFMEVGCFN